jgi:hypothetical protein
LIDPEIDEAHAAFTDCPWIWDLTPDGQPKDDMADWRRQWCAGRSGLDKQICEIASLGHPNRAGAHRYARKIYEALYCREPS